MEAWICQGENPAARLPHEEKGSAMLQSIVQSSRIVSHSPKQQVK